MVQKKTKTSVVEKQHEVVGSLKKLGTDIYNQLDKGVFPTINMPSRSTENIDYDPSVRQYVLGDKVVSRSARNIRHVKPFTQFICNFAAQFRAVRQEFFADGFIGDFGAADVDDDGDWHFW